MYLKNIIKDGSIQLLDILPKLKQKTLYNISIYQKYKGVYYNTYPINYILFIIDDNHYLYHPKKTFIINSNIKYYKNIDDVNIGGDLPIKVVISESDLSFYKINVNNIKTIYICSNYMIPLYKEIYKILKYYEYNIIDIKTNCLIEDNYIIESNQINEICVDVEIIKYKSLYKKLLSIIFSKKII